MDAIEVKEYYRSAFNAAISEIANNGFDTIWNDNQAVAGATVTITMEPNQIVYVTYKKDVYTMPPKVVPITDNTKRDED
jgi:hypothetical protein